MTSKTNVKQSTKQYKSTEFQAPIKKFGGGKGKNNRNSYRNTIGLSVTAPQSF